MFTRNYDCSADSYSFDATATTKQKLLGLLFVLFWSSLTLLFDSIIGYRAVKQLQSNSFPSVKGRITRSESHRDGSGKGREPMMSIGLTYDFEVGGQSYSGSQFRYGTGSSSFSAGYASRVIQSLPVGLEVDVFYNPADPKDCVLSRGLDGGDLFMAMFITPFNLFMLGLWAGLWHLLRSIFARRKSDRLSELFVTDDSSPMIAALAELAAASFLMTFVVGIPTGSFHPSKLVMQVVWIILIASAVITYFVVWRNRAKSKPSLEDAHE